MSAGTKRAVPDGDNNDDSAMTEPNINYESIIDELTRKLETINDHLMQQQTSIQELLSDDFFINRLKFEIGPLNFELGHYENEQLLSVIEETVYLTSKLKDIANRKHANDVKEEATNYLYSLNNAIENSTKNEINCAGISSSFNVDDLLESPKEYVSETLKKIRRVCPDVYKLINFKSTFDSVEDKQPEQNDDNDEYSFSTNDDAFDNEGLRSIEKKESGLESSAEVFANSAPDVELAKKQWDLLSAKMTIILNQCSKKFTQGRDIINLFLSNSKVLIHSDILDKITPRLEEIDNYFPELSAQKMSVEKQDTAPVKKITPPTISVKKEKKAVRLDSGLDQGRAVVQKYAASLEFVDLLKSRFENLKTIYGVKFAANNIEQMGSCVKTLSELLQLGSALYSPVHLTHFMIESAEVNNVNQSFTPLIPRPVPAVMREFNLSERVKGITNYDWLQNVLKNKSVGFVRIVSGASAISPIFTPFEINVSLLSEDNATPLLSLTCASGIERKIAYLKQVFDNSQRGYSPQMDCGSFESLFFARDGKLGEFLQICILSILKFTTLLQKAGDSQMPIQVGVENLMKHTSNAIHCFMNVYNFVASWCLTENRSDPWVDNVTKELLSLLFKFIQFYGERFLINKFSFNKGRENLCPAPENPKEDLAPDSLDPEDPQTRVAIPLYENSKPGVVSYDNYALMMNRGFNGEYYSDNLDAAIAQLRDDKKLLRQQIKALKERPLQKMDAPPKRANDGSIKPPPTKEEVLRDLEARMVQFESDETKMKTKTQLEDDSANFIPVFQAPPLEHAPPPIGELSWDTFKKYMENYIVNFCKQGQPSLKMISFLKMMHLNAVMVRLGWGFIDLAGGSLMNFLKRRFVVTADYDSKIYFLTEDVPEEELRSRFTYIKMCMINLGIEINNYMIDNDFFGGAKIKAQFSFKPLIVAPGAPTQIPLDLLTVLLELPTGRWFSSRGKEPELFPVPLYSSDMFWSVKLLCAAEQPTISVANRIRIFKSDSFTISIGYEDLVFKNLEKHFLYKALKGHGETHDVAMRIIYSTFVSPYNFDAADASMAKMNTSRWFALRIPSLYEIEYDIKSMLQEPELKNARMAVGKNQKDVDRDRLVALLKSLIIEKENIRRTATRVPPLTGTEEIKFFFMNYPIASTFANKIQLYFQTDLFKTCCKRVGLNNPKMMGAMLRPPLGIINNETNNIALNKNKNNFLLPPVFIEGSETRGDTRVGKKSKSDAFNYEPSETTLELTQLMRRAVLYSYNTTSKIFITTVYLTKKYGEFKSVADFERLQHIQQFDFNVTASGIGFGLFNYELWVSRGKLQSPVPFENCYFAVLNEARGGLIYNDAGYQARRSALSGQTATLPQFAQLVSGVQAPGGAPDPYQIGVVDRTPITGDNLPIKNTTAETIATKIDASRLNPLYGSLREVVGAVTMVPVETGIDAARGRARPATSRFEEMLIGEPLRLPVSVYGGGKHLTKKRISASPSLLLFTRRNRNRNQLLKQKKRTIKKREKGEKGQKGEKGERKKRNGEGEGKGKGKKSLKRG